MRPLIVACGALVRELRAVMSDGPIDAAFDVEYLPSPLHNRPDRIVAAIDERLSSEPLDRRIVLGYADCGTGGMLDSYIASSPRMITRLSGDHCYEFFAGTQRFTDLFSEEIGTFFLTDYLAKHFDALVWRGLGLDRSPGLRDTYFGNYRRVVLITQTADPAVVEAGRRAAERMELDFCVDHAGLGPFAGALAAAATPVSIAKVA